MSPRALFWSAKGCLERLRVSRGEGAWLACHPTRLFFAAAQGGDGLAALRPKQAD